MDDINGGVVVPVVFLFVVFLIMVDGFFILAHEFCDDITDGGVTVQLRTAMDCG